MQKKKKCEDTGKIQLGTNWKQWKPITKWPTERSTLKAQTASEIGGVHIQQLLYSNDHE